jgi:hypothetical protein
MWSLLKAELSYDKHLLITLILFVALTFWGEASLVRSGISVDPSIPYTIAACLMFLVFSSRSTEKRTRYHHLLPVDIHKLGMVRLFFQSVYLISVLALFWFYQLYAVPSGFHHLPIWRFLFLSSLLIITNAAFSLSFDIWLGIQHKDRFLKIIIFMFLWLSVLSVGVFHVESWIYDMLNRPFPAFIRMIYYKPIGVIGLHVLGLGLSYLSVVIFVRRKSYLE